MKSILVITGMSGSGKSTAIRALEDAGWFCIDNLPAPLLMKVTELGESRDQLAFVIDVREGQFLKDAPRAIEEARRAGHQVEVLFLDASDEALTRGIPMPQALSPEARAWPRAFPGARGAGTTWEQAEHVLTPDADRARAAAPGDARQYCHGLAHRDVLRLRVRRPATRTWC